jgi:hypothetical protein
MPKSLFKVPTNLVNEWPEIFEDMWMSTMPLNYLHTLQIEFTNGRVWEINIKEQLAKVESEILSKKLLETFKEYQDSIKKINFHLDVVRLKDDISSLTKNIL